MGCSSCFSIKRNWSSHGEWFEMLLEFEMHMLLVLSWRFSIQISHICCSNVFGWMEDWRSLKCGIVEWGFDWLNWKNGMDVERAGGSFSCRVGLGEEGIDSPRFGFDSSRVGLKNGSFSAIMGQFARANLQFARAKEVLWPVHSS